MEHLSEKQRVWLDHVMACGKAEVSMKAYAERHDLDLQQFYFWKGHLRKLGVIDAGQNRQDAAPASATSAQQLGGKTRIQLSNGINLEVPGNYSADALAALLRHAMQLQMMRPDNDIEFVWLCRVPVDFRKQINGLSILVEEQLSRDPFSGHLFVFVNKNRDKIKILY